MVDAESQCRGNSFPRVRRDEAQRLVDTAPDLAAEVERLRGYVHQLKVEDGERLAKVEEQWKKGRAQEEQQAGHSGRAYERQLQERMAQDADATKTKRPESPSFDDSDSQSQSQEESQPLF